MTVLRVWHAPAMQVEPFLNFVSIERPVCAVGECYSAMGNALLEQRGGVRMQFTVIFAADVFSPAFMHARVCLVACMIRGPLHVCKAAGMVGIGPGMLLLSLLKNWLHCMGRQAFYIAVLASC